MHMPNFWSLTPRENKFCYMNLQSGKGDWWLPHRRWHCHVAVWRTPSRAWRSVDVANAWRAFKYTKPVTSSSLIIQGEESQVFYLFLSLFNWYLRKPDFMIRMNIAILLWFWIVGSDIRTIFRRILWIMTKFKLAGYIVTIVVLKLIVKPGM